MVNPEGIKIVGVMSGSSLDGLDLAVCRFSRSGVAWNFTLDHTQTIPYTPDMIMALRSAQGISPDELCRLDHNYGKWIGREIKSFLEKNSCKAGWISSHGHTIFHQPSRGFSLQIGNGNDIHAETGIPVVYDFRSADVALGGQGAPLVPAGDEMLFGNYGSCLNLGGFSNISYNKNGKRLAFDICPVNMGLNYLAAKLGKDFDKDGELGRKGSIIPELVKKLNGLDYYQKEPPKSTGIEWFKSYFEPVLLMESDILNILRSLYEHIADQISNTLNTIRPKDVLVTGGGANNKFLMELIGMKSIVKIIIPEQNLVDFKEALIFAFLGCLRIQNRVNVYSSVTGSLSDHSAGVIINFLNK
jgi:anhydro-N-acetylmuramic acid kinase